MLVVDERFSFSATTAAQISFTEIRVILPRAAVLLSERSWCPRPRDASPLRPVAQRNSWSGPTN